MSRSIFGWDLPPGCTTRHIDEAYGVEQPCDVCGKNVDDCICPECECCGEVGQLKCYTDGHGTKRLKLSREQIIAREEARIVRLKMELDGREEGLHYMKDPGIEWPADVSGDGLEIYSDDAHINPDPWK